MANIKQTVDLTQGTFNNLVVVNNKLQLPSVAAPTFTRNSIAYKSDGTQVAANQPRFDVIDGVLGWMVEEGTTNLLGSYSSFEIDSNSDGLADRWFVGVSGRDSGRVYNNRLVPALYHGQYAQRIEIVSTTNSNITNLDCGNISISPNTTYTLSAYVKTNVPNKVKLLLEWYDASWAWIGDAESNQVTVTNQVVRISVTATSPSNAAEVIAYVRGINSSGEWFEVDAVQLEAKPYATSFIDGTRAAETLTIPTAGVLNPQEGTIECWVYVPEFWEQGIPYWRRIWSIGMYVLYYAPYTGKIHFTIFNDSGGDQIISVNKPTVGWHFFAAKWSASEMALFIDGVKVGSIANPSLPSSFADTVISIGCRPDDPYDNVNTLIDDLRISSRARTDEEIAAAYQSGQPMPIDEYTTYLLRFSGALNFGRGGYYISPQYDLSTVGSYVKHRVYWQEDADQGECLVYAKLDNQSDWTQLTNGGSLPIVVGQDLTGRNIQFKAKLLDLV